MKIKRPDNFMLNEITARARRDYGSSFTKLRLVVTLLLLFTLGRVNVWGQTGTDRSGVYYFVNCGSGKDDSDPKIEESITDPNEYFYLVPADNPKQDNKRDAWFSSDYTTANGDPQMPYLTTYKTKKDAANIPEGVTNRPHNSVWIVEFASTDNGTDYYHIIHAATGKYVVYEPPYSDKNNRKSVHLLTTGSPDENAKFAITTRSDYYNFRPNGIGTGKNDNKYLNTAQKNYNSYNAGEATADLPADYFRGLVGLWRNNGSATDGSASDWKLEAVIFSEQPFISDVSEETNTVTVTVPNWLPEVPEGYNIRYTFSAEGEPDDPTATSSEMTNGEFEVTVAGTLKVVVERYGVLLSAVATKTVEPAQCKTPVITYSTETGKVTITSTEGASIFYTLDGTTPTTSSIPYTGPFEVTDQQAVTVTAIATKASFIDSETTSSIVVLNPTIILAETEYIYDGSAKEPVVSSVKAGETLIDPNDNEYTVDYENNTAAGTATVKIVDNDGGAYIVYGSTTFIINKADITPSVTIASWTYGGEASTPSVSGNLDSSAVTYEYKVQGAGDKTYTETVPTNAGNYTIRATIAATNNCNAGTATTDFTISKAELTATVTIDGWTYGTAAKKPSVSGNTENGTVTYEYKVKDAVDDTYTTTVPTNAGSYTIRATISATTNYNGKQVTTDFIISKADINPTVTMVGWTYGEAANTPSVIGNTGNGTVTYEYKVKDADDNTYTTTVPTIAGNYTIRATIAATLNYSGKSVTKDFTINRATITPIVTIANWTYGTTASTPSVTGNTENGTVTYEYKVKDAIDNTYTTTVPTDAGHYTLRAAIAGTTNYKGNYATTNFSINKATFTPTVSMTGWTYGDDANAPTVTGNTSSGTVTYEYKLTSAADATYTTKVPKDAGSYTVRATIAETANYNGAVATATFTITSKAINTGDVPIEGVTVDFKKNSSGQYETVLKYNGTTLEEGVAYDYTVTKTETPKYITATITGTDHNYSGSFTIKFAKVNFTKKEGSGTPGGVGTFVTNADDGDFVTPTNMTAYIVTEISGNSVLTEKVDYICEDMPVLLLSTEDADGFIVQLETDVDVLYSDEEKSERVGKNKLEKKSTDWTLTEPEIYLLYKGEFVLNAPGTLEAGKIYLPMPSNASPSPRLAIAWGDVTVIEDGRCEMDDGRSEHWYTLDGRRINGKPSMKGLYIVNGKKVVIK